MLVCLLICYEQVTFTIMVQHNRKQLPVTIATVGTELNWTELTVVSVVSVETLVILGSDVTVVTIVTVSKVVFAW